MDQTTDDAQSGALFGSSPNTSAMDAQTLNPAASGPNDWTTVLTNGIANAAVMGINGAVANAVNSGAINNQITAQNAGLFGGGAVGISLMPLLIIGGIIYMAVK